MNPRSLSSHGGIFLRAAREGTRNPGPGFILSLLPPALLVIALTSLFGQLGSVIAFPTGSFKEYFAPGALMIVAIAGGGFTAAQLASDVGSGYIDRLRMHTADTASLLVGRFLFEAVRVIPAAICVLAIALAFGGANPNGLPGALAAITLVAMTSTAYAGLFYVVAIVTRDPQTPLNLNPIGTIIAFLSTAFVPRSAMPGWMSAIARFNPMTYLVNGVRAAMIGDLTSSTVLVGFATAAVGILAAFAASILTLARTLNRR